MADSFLQYAQEGDVGPWCVGQPAMAADALRVGVRLARLAPSGGGDGAFDASGSASPIPAVRSPTRGFDNDSPGDGGGAGAAGGSSSGGAGGAPSASFILEGVSASLLTKRLAPPAAAGAQPRAAGEGLQPVEEGADQQQPQQPPAERSAGVAQVQWDEWDTEFVVLRQWFAHAVLSVKPPADAAARPQQQQQQQQQGPPASGTGDGGAAPPNPSAKQAHGIRSPTRHHQQQQPAAAADPLPPPPALQLVVYAQGSAAAPRSHHADRGRGDSSTTTATTSSSSSSSNNAAQQPDDCSLSVALSLKSFMLEASPEASAVFLRLVNRWMAYDRFAPLWKTRPQLPVRAAPALWWQHAGRAVLAECRRRLPVRQAALALARRREYLAVYRAVHAAVPREFIARPRDPPLPRITSSPTLAPAAAAIRLRALEESMTPSQVSIYRVFVAARHSAYLAVHPGPRAQWLEAMDALGSFLDLVPTQGAEKATSSLVGAWFWGV
jgi:hypothetical protein